MSDTESAGEGGRNGEKDEQEREGGKREEVGDGKTKSKDRHCELCVMSIKQILNL